MRFNLYLFTFFSTCLLAPIAQAQLGVSPSQNAAFLSELRARDADRSESEKDVLGGDRLLMERGREVSQWRLFKYWGIEAQRLGADITGFNGQYQLGRRYLSPFYFGVEAPKSPVLKTDALSLSMALQVDFTFQADTSGWASPVFVSPTLLWDGSYILSDNQRLTFTGGLQINWDLESGRFNSDYWSDELGFGLLPGTSLAYDLDLDTLHVTAYDRVSARPYLGMLQNDLGLAATWRLAAKWSWTLNYTFSKTYDIDGAYGPDFGYYSFGGLDFNQHTISSELIFEQSTAIELGLEAAMTWYRPDNQGINRDYGAPPFSFWANGAVKADFFNAGAFVKWRPTSKMQLRVAVGMQNAQTAASYDPFSNNTRADTSSPYYTVAFTQKLNELWSHELAVGYENVLGLGGFYNRAHYINYGMTGKVRKGGQFTASAFYEHMDPYDFKPWTASDTVDSAGIDLHFAQRINSRLNMDLGYSLAYLQRRYINPPYIKSREDTYNNLQHMASIGARYALTENTQIHFNVQGVLFQAGSNFAGAGRFQLGIRTDF
ncbi:MAG: hypothetical protein NTV80_09855 [Verrucomicrobia bacterium]|nr:hypothetical protein [Verrucomicrobiota bacterium]